MYTYSTPIEDVMESIITSADIPVPKEIEQDYYLFLHNHYDIMVRLRHGEFRGRYDKLYSYVPFFINMLRVYMEIPIKEPDERINVCGFLYDTIVYHDAGEYLQKLVYQIGEVVNRQDIDNLYYKLNGQLDRSLCNFIILTKYSTFKQHLAVSRINFALCTSYHKLFTVNDVIAIYQVLFPNDFLNTFLATFKNTIIQDAYKKGSKWVTQLALENDNIIDVTMCKILDSMDANSVSTVLESYCNACAIKKNIKSIVSIISRFPKDFIRIPIIIEELKGKGIYIH